MRVKNAVLPGDVKVRRLPRGLPRGLRMEIDFSRHTQLYLGLYEYELHRSLRALARPGVAAFDIGGSSGYDALLLAKLTGAPVLTVEANPGVLGTLRRNVAANPSLDVRVVHATIGATDDDTTRTIDALAHDDSCGGFVPGLVKIDIEGGEATALRGATRLLSERGPALVVEVHSVALEDETRAVVAAAGYPEPTVVTQRHVFKEYRPLAHNRWLVWSPPAHGSTTG
ncbi:MAG: FkbM family methyltransferase [Acidimicrobiia bacterium]